MPTLDQYQPTRRVLIVGDSGSGKTTAIAKLAEAGQELFIADFDNNLNAIPQFVSREALKHIHYETLVDPIVYNEAGTPTIKSIPKAFSRFTQLAKEWVDSETGESYGKPEEWPDNYWFVLDPLTAFGAAIMYHTQYKRKTLGKQRTFKDWGDAMQRIEGTLDMFKASNVNFICTAHLSRLNMEDVTETMDNQGNVIDNPTAARRLPPNAMMRYPIALGQKLPPKVGGYFNMILQCQRIGAGPAAKRVIRTVPEEDVDVKVPLSKKSKVPAEVPVDQLWSILKHFQGDK